MWLGATSVHRITPAVHALMSIMSTQLLIIYVLTVQYRSPTALCVILFQCAPNVLSGLLLIRGQHIVASPAQPE